MQIDMGMRGTQMMMVSGYTTSERGVRRYTTNARSISGYTISEMGIMGYTLEAIAFLNVIYALSYLYLIPFLHNFQLTLCRYIAKYIHMYFCRNTFELFCTYNTIFLLSKGEIRDPKYSFELLCRSIEMGATLGPNSKICMLLLFLLKLLNNFMNIYEFFFLYLSNKLVYSAF